MGASLSHRRLQILALAAGLLIAGTLAGGQLRGGMAAVLGFDLLSGERVRVEVDASLGRSDVEQVGRDFARAGTRLHDVQLDHARQALIAMGVEGAASMSNEEIERRVREAQVQAMQGFYGQLPELPKESGELSEIR